LSALNAHAPAVLQTANGAKRIATQGFNAGRRHTSEACPYLCVDDDRLACRLDQGTLPILNGADELRLLFENLVRLLLVERHASGNASAEQQGPAYDESDNQDATRLIW
tara:strand:+ start:1498 stop:1824 length:327 start_codon:yes stop_codon:yes gene_type:complete